LVVDAGGVGQLVTVERDPGPGQPVAVAFTYRDALPDPAGLPSGAPPGGHFPYFVRVTQQDGHVAWSSPIFISPR
jgi:hypothetical protein